MDNRNIDLLAQYLASSYSRRTAVTTLVTGTLAFATRHLVAIEAAAALLANGKPCRRGRQCLSGLCKGAGGKKKCRRAPGQGICTVESNAGALPPIQTDCNNAASSEACLCWVTTAGRSFCGRAALASCGCGADNDCANVPGAVCVENRPGGFAGCGIACVLPCPAPA